MTETTKQILSVLAAAADGEVRDVPLWPAGYQAAAIQAAASEVAPYCDFTLQEDPGGSLRLSVSVRPEHRAASRTILGELLNHAFLLSARQILGTVPHGE